MNYYSLNDIVRSYKISKTTLIKMVEAGKIKCTIIGNVEHPKERHYYFPEDELKKLEPRSGVNILEHLNINYSPENFFKRFEEERFYIWERGKVSYYKFPYEEYMQSSEWKQKSLQRFKIDDYRCQRCGSAKNILAHHLNYNNLGNEKMEDLITLCRKCHEEIHINDIKRKYDIEV